MNRIDGLKSAIEKRILILDGAMGTMIQQHHLNEADFRGQRFAHHPKKLQGCNDLLCLTQPRLIYDIHTAYLMAGADLIETCSFNANAPSLDDYGLGHLAREISRASAELARRACEAAATPEHPRYVVGVLGPTGKTASISADVSDGAARSITWDQLVQAYSENAMGLLEGGADILMLETIFDTLNAKAALFAIDEAIKTLNSLERTEGSEKRYTRPPIMISGTITDAAGRTLSGQTVAAFHASLSHGQPFSTGLNCALGADKLLPHLQELSEISPFLLSAHPNAGLPNSLGEYDQSAQEMAQAVRPFLEQGLVNIVGGCCGSTPVHIAEIAKLAKNFPPRKPKAPLRRTILSGLEALELPSRFGPLEQHGGNFIDIGERTNVAGSRRFLRLIKEEKWEEASLIAREMGESGAAIIDVCMDDALLDARASMVHFLNTAQSDPEVARLPFMIDSSRWEVIEAGLKCIQGKGLVNSISLKEGEQEFLQRAALARRYGAAIVVMLFDEAGQADSYARKIEIAGRSWKLLMGAGFPAEDVVFDPNVLSIATGIEEHRGYALDFIEACRWISANCPGAHISGGLSNLSFSFRGNEAVREAMHAVFLKHAIPAGLSMAIVNPGALRSVGELEAELVQLCEAVILNQGPQAEEALLQKALQLRENQDGSPKLSAGEAKKNAWRELALPERISHALVRGEEGYIEADVLALKSQGGDSALSLIEGPLMDGMNEVGRRFGLGQMFLPQVIRSARVMKKAVAVLEPFIQEEKNEDSQAAATIVLATVKGDVHDIGKNIVGLVLSCNGFRVIDLGVMVPTEEMLAAIEREKADVLGLSGLITPSLDEMVNVARAMEGAGLKIPLLVGGATTSETHTALRIAPAYSGPVVHGKDASQMPAIVRALLSPSEGPAFLARLEQGYKAAIERHEGQKLRQKPISLAQARKNAFASDWQKIDIDEPKTQGLIDLAPGELAELYPWIDWNWFFYSWDLGYGKEQALNDSKKAEAATKLYEDAQALLRRFAQDGHIRPAARIGIFPAASEGDDLLIYPNIDSKKAREVSASAAPALAGLGREVRLPFLRNQQEKKAGGANPCLTDFIAPKASGRRDWVGFFALTVGAGFETWLAECAKADEYEVLLAKSLADRLAEAMAEWAHAKLRREIWGYAPNEKLAPEECFDFSADGRTKYRGIRPAFGYPACPDHEDKGLAFELLDARNKLGMDLTESAMMLPAASVCGMYFAHPQSWYFGTGKIDSEQLADFAARKTINLEEARRRLSSIIME